MSVLTMTHTVPTEVGHYWFTDQHDVFDTTEPQVVYVRDYAGDLAIGNWCFLEAATINPERFLWAGPIPRPVVPQS
jgi:hypothetical protein